MEQEKRKATLSEVSYLLSQLIKYGYKYHGKPVEPYSEASDVIFSKLYEKVTTRQRNYMLALLYDSEYKKLETILDNFKN